MSFPPPGGVVAVRQMGDTGNRWPEIKRVIPFSVTVASIGTPVTVWSPGAGNRIRVVGFDYGVASTSLVILRTAASTTFQWTAPVTPTVPYKSPDLRFGLPVPSLNTALLLDGATLTTAPDGGLKIFGTIFGIEEPTL